jgi:hypothetical protein
VTTRTGFISDLAPFCDAEPDEDAGSSTSGPAMPCSRNQVSFAASIAYAAMLPVGIVLRISPSRSTWSRSRLSR